MHKILVTEKVLIAEDNLAMSAILSNKLKAEGFEVTTAENGQEALDHLKTEQFNLLLMDLTMPDFDGFQLLERIQKEQMHIPIIVMSSLSQPEDKVRAMSLGANKFIVKTEVTPNVIVKEIEETLAIFA